MCPSSWDESRAINQPHAKDNVKLEPPTIWPNRVIFFCSLLTGTHSSASRSRGPRSTTPLKANSRHTHKQNDDKLKRQKSCSSAAYYICSGVRKWHSYEHTPTHAQHTRGKITHTYKTARTLAWHTLRRIKEKKRERTKRRMLKKDNSLTKRRYNTRKKTKKKQARSTKSQGGPKRYKTKTNTF